MDLKCTVELSPVDGILWSGGEGRPDVGRGRVKIDFELSLFTGNPRRTVFVDNGNRDENLKKRKREEEKQVEKRENRFPKSFLDFVALSKRKTTKAGCQSVRSCPFLQRALAYLSHCFCGEESSVDPRSREESGERIKQKRVAVRDKTGTGWKGTSSCIGYC